MKTILIIIIFIASYLLLSEEIMKNSEDLLFSKEVLAAVIGASVLIGGYTYSSSQQTKLEAYKIKAQAYANLVSELESALPAKDGDLLDDNDKIRKLNVALSTTLLYAPDKISKEINDIANKPGQPRRNGRELIQQILLILHKDLNQETLSTIQTTDFPFFPPFTK